MHPCSSFVRSNLAKLKIITWQLSMLRAGARLVADFLIAGLLCEPRCLAPSGVGEMPILVFLGSGEEACPLHCCWTLVLDTTTIMASTHIFLPASLACP
jgi:hypothetical protein